MSGQKFVSSRICLFKSISSQEFSFQDFVSFLQFCPLENTWGVYLLIFCPIRSFFWKSLLVKDFIFIDLYITVSFNIMYNRRIIFFLACHWRKHQVTFEKLAILLSILNLDCLMNSVFNVSTFNFMTDAWSRNKAYPWRVWPETTTKYYRGNISP